MIFSKDNFLICEPKKRKLFLNWVAYWQHFMFYVSFTVSLTIRIQNFRYKYWIGIVVSEYARKMFVFPFNWIEFSVIGIYVTLNFDCNPHQKSLQTLICKNVWFFHCIWLRGTQMEIQWGLYGPSSKTNETAIAVLPKEEG